jgi:hypothetical protein
MAGMPLKTYPPLLKYIRSANQDKRWREARATTSTTASPTPSASQVNENPVEGRLVTGTGVELGLGSGVTVGTAVCSTSGCCVKVAVAVGGSAR